MGAGGLLFENAKLQRVMVAQVAGTSDTLTSTGVDMTGYDGVVFLLSVGTLTATAVTSFHAAQGDTLGGSYADLAGTSQSLTAGTHDDFMGSLTIHRPGDRFVRLEIVRATANAVIDDVTAIRYRGNHPVTHDAATVATTELHISPDEGTA